MREILKHVASHLSPTLTGTERQQFLNTCLQTLPHKQMEMLRETVNSMLMRMTSNHASDIDLGGHGCRNQVWYRIYGQKCPDETLCVFAEDETDILCQSLLSDNQKAYLFEHRNLDFSYTITCQNQRHRFRGDLYFDLDHLALNMRYLPSHIRPFKHLGLHATVVKAMMLAYDKQGLTLVTGVTGSGKSSTLDSIIDANNQTVDAHITIIGAPIETVHTSARSIVRHREVGRDVMSFKEGTIQALRQDPDIIVIGEMRDPETIMTALDVTDSGHKVFSTLHTASAVESIDRIIAECPVLEQNRVRERLADTLKCIISQKLVPSLDGKRVLAKEVLLMTPSVRAAIKNNNTGEIYQMMHENKTQGMTTMEQDLKQLVAGQLISAQEALGFANNKRRMEALL